MHVPGAGAQEAHVAGPRAEGLERRLALHSGGWRGRAGWPPANSAGGQPANAFQHAGGTLRPEAPTSTRCATARSSSPTFSSSAAFVLKALELEKPVILLPSACPAQNSIHGSWDL